MFSDFGIMTEVNVKSKVLVSPVSRSSAHKTLHAVTPCLFKYSRMSDSLLYLNMAKCITLLGVLQVVALLNEHYIPND